MADINFPDEIPSATPTSADLLLFADVSDSGNAKDCPMSDLPISTPTQTALDGKVDKVAGKGLSTEDYTTTEKSKLAAITGVNTGDQTSIVGITGTKAQFDTACTDGNFMYTGDTATSTNALQSATTTINVSSATAPSAGQVLTATSGTAATWQTPSGGG
jgi:hypothetical protein